MLVCDQCPFYSPVVATQQSLWNEAVGTSIKSHVCFMIYEAPLSNSILFLFQFYIEVNSGPRGDEVNLWAEEASKDRPALQSELPRIRLRKGGGKALLAPFPLPVPEPKVGECFTWHRL